MGNSKSRTSKRRKKKGFTKPINLIQNGYFSSNKAKRTSESKIKEKFEKISLIGSGEFSKVFLVRKKKSEKYYAMKVLRKKDLVKNSNFRHVQTERYLAENLNHPFIYQCRYAFQTEEMLCLVFDFVQGGQLYHQIKKERFSDERIKFYAAEIFLAISFLHSNGIIHCDLKPENILIDKDGHIKLSDFGLSSVLNFNSNHKIVGSPLYWDPQIINLLKTGDEKEIENYKITKSADYWSIGCILFFCATGWHPFHSEVDAGMYYNIANRKITKDNFDPFLNISDSCQELIIALLEKDPKKRLGCGKDGINDILKHDFFKDINFHEVLQKKIKPPFIPDVQNGYDTSYCKNNGTNTEETNKQQTKEPLVEDTSEQRECIELPDSLKNVEGFNFINLKNLSPSTSSFGTPSPCSSSWSASDFSDFEDDHESDNLGKKF